MNNYIGLDIGGTKIFGKRVGQNQQIENSFQTPTQAEKNKETILNNIYKTIDNLINTQTKGVGISWAGFVDSHKGLIKKSPNFKDFDNIKICKILEKKYKIPVKIENDAKLFALAEQQINFPDSKMFLGIIVGTGIGCGIIYKGKILKGSSGYAGEIGHLLYNLDLDDEIEQVLANEGLAKLCQETTAINTLEEISEALKSCQKIDLEIITNKFARFLYNLCLVFDPDTIVFGGGIGKNLLPHIKKDINLKLKNLLQKKDYPINCKVETTTISNGGAMGAYLIAKESVSCINF